MGDTSETNTKVLSRELVLGAVALKRLYRKIIICATWALFPGTVTYIYIYIRTDPITLPCSLVRAGNYITLLVMSQFAFTVQIKKILNTSTIMLLPSMFFMFKCQRKHLQAKVMIELCLLCCELLV